MEAQKISSLAKTRTCFQRYRRRANAGPTHGSTDPKQGLRILVSGESAALRQLIAAILTTEGHVVDSVGTLAEQIEHFKRERYQVVVFDRGTWLSVRFIGADARQDVLLRKPFTPAQLRQAVAVVAVTR